jgi:hypothetical protein
MRLLLLASFACSSAHESAPAPAPRATRLPAEDLPSALRQATSFFEGRPAEERPLTVELAAVPGLPSMNAAACGACHVEIYEEWRVSTHAHAWTDPQFQAEITKSDNLWLCRNCHTPLLEQHPEWPVGLHQDDVEAPILLPNPQWDPALQAEGITCAACHVRNGTVVGPGLPDSVAPHPVAAWPDLTDEAICIRCHQAEREYPGKPFICTFSTGAEWAASIHAAEGRRCQTCHMPEIRRPAATGGPERLVRRHWFKGSGIPKFRDAAPPDEALPGPGLAVKLHHEPGETFITLRNDGAGHYLPTGDPERWISLEGVFYDHDGEVVGKPWELRIGQEWTWHPTPRKISDNRVAPGERRVVRLPTPPTAGRFEVRVHSHRMSEANATWHKLVDYPLSILTHHERLDLGPRR